MLIKKAKPMFFLKTLEHRISLPPSSFGPSIKSDIRTRLHNEVEGTCSGRYGYIICILKVDDIGDAEIEDSTGCAIFHVTYTAIILRPFKNQVVDSIVSSVNKMGIFANVGPLQVFVSSHLIPPDIRYDTATGIYLSEDRAQKIAKDDYLRLKIVGTRIDATEIFAIGTIKEDYLGLIN